MPAASGTMRCVGRLLGLCWMATAVACLAAGCDSGQTAASTTSGVVKSEPSTTDSSRSAINALIDQITGHTVSYRVELESPSVVGVWNVVERDGEIVEAEYVGDAEPHEDQPWLSLSGALRLAADADETVAVSDQQPATNIRLTVDSDVNATDDEFELYASNITILSW